MSKTKAIILLTVFIDVIGLGIVIPILPFYVSRFSDSALVITSLFAIFALCSFFSAPIIGALSDKYGRRPMLIMSIFSTAFGWFVFAGAPNIIFLFIGRIIDGIMAGNFPIAQSYLTDIAKTDKERTTNLGLIGATFGIGFILGPMLGGVLGQFGHTVPFWFVGVLALFNGILALFILPETHTELSTKKISINPFSPLLRAAKNNILRSNYVAWFLFGLAIASYQSIFSLYLRDVFQFNELTGGILYGFLGVIIAVNQGFAMKHVWLKYFKEPTLELATLGAYVIGFLFLSVNSFIIFCIALLINTFGQSILRVVMTSQVVGQSSSKERGEVLGILSSITSLSMMIGPFIAGVMYEKLTILPFLFSSVCLFLAFIVLFLRRRKLAKMKLPEDVPMESLI
ncbi:MFS transporter [Candidatus Dojkabacteria bacterium]|nr:MFS transporter [Candidatus Dojkabacteria bacterium]